jgi:hypothetical protein
VTTMLILTPASRRQGGVGFDYDADRELFTTSEAQIGDLRLRGYLRAALRDRAERTAAAEAAHLKLVSKMLVEVEQRIAGRNVTLSELEARAGLGSAEG